MRKPDSRFDDPPEKKKSSYHQLQDREKEVPAETGPAASQGQQAAKAGNLPQRQPAIRISMPSDLQVHISPAHGASEPAPMKDYGKYSVEELQKLIVWSEILNTPIGLRDPD